MGAQGGSGALIYKPHTRCRACGYGPAVTAQAIKSGHGTERLIPVLDLGIQPLANDFRGADEPKAGFAPLQVLYCPRCGLAQLSVVVDPKILYSDYPYVTSPSATMKAHFEAIRQDILAEATAVESVLEIGSNDGLLLSFLKNNPFAVVTGFEPAFNLAQLAYKQQLTVYQDFFCLKTLEASGTPWLTKDVIIARHVLSQIDDWRDFLEALKLVSHQETLVCIEVPWVIEQLRNNSWDQVYHEHLSYISVTGIHGLLKGSDFHLHRVIQYPIHGGSLMLMLHRNESTIPAHPSVCGYLQIEERELSEKAWTGLSERSMVGRMELHKLIFELLSQGKRICGYGASAKATVWINTCKLSRKQISFVCDCTPQKQYKLIPGTDIPVMDEGALLRELPDYCVCFAWNFFEEIKAKEKLFVEKGGRWILPVPKVEVV